MSAWNFKDLTGMKFGRLTVIERTENSESGKTRWLCRCDCGKEIVVCGCNLKNNHTQSCGCIHHEVVSRVFGTHHMSQSRIYSIWVNIKTRCLNHKAVNYHNYGGRGITICNEWQNDFQAFYDYVSKLEHFNEKGYSLDRINNNGNYEPNNLRWADLKTQSRNTRANLIVIYKGKSMPLIDAAELSGIAFPTLWARVRNGDTGDRLFRPVKKFSRKN